MKMKTGHTPKIRKCKKTGIASRDQMLSKSTDNSPLQEAIKFQNCDQEVWKATRIRMAKSMLEKSEYSPAMRKTQSLRNKTLKAGPRDKEIPEIRAIQRMKPPMRRAIQVKMISTMTTIRFKKMRNQQTLKEVLKNTQSTTKSILTKARGNKLAS